MSTAKIIDVWAVHEGDDDRSSGHPKYYFSNRENAYAYAKGKGWWGGNAPVSEFKGLLVDHKVYILQQLEPIVLDNLSIQQNVVSKAKERLSNKEWETLVEAIKNGHE